MTFLLDTNVVAELRKRSMHPAVRSWFSSVPGAELHVSVLVIGEIRQGAERLRRKDPEQADQIDTWLAVLGRDFSDRVVPICPRVADEWGRLNAGNRLPVVDGLMAATARVHGLTMVTRNIVDFHRAGVALLNPFGAG